MSKPRAAAPDATAQTNKPIGNVIALFILPGEVALPDREGRIDQHN
ncbi:hypothetical protein [Citrobacter freundii]|nr:hypothetical protein [Citrobacter freundii]MBJ9313115.1 hypothetical protein [Citrobacter freundii]HEI8943234.1 hypothetical protein [Citrobacter freundii]HEJ0170277.1 hypothetical protein [Citrobacter freundii]